ncbi:hypothetical protein EVAR_79391_1 [Eumeta japonica]|uniref:Uncharacterized protein n=1 Tax=Eumeta variegata TaxID=151549 RepID=A0A4C1VE99_EUMVA|nr:hypothetical protein EVAR_79391_1 [Eumeta japonica]
MSSVRWYSLSETATHQSLAGHCWLRVAKGLTTWKSRGEAKSSDARLKIERNEHNTSFYDPITRMTYLYDLTADAGAGDVDVFDCRPTAFKRSIHDVFFQ